MGVVRRVGPCLGGAFAPRFLLDLPPPPDGSLFVYCTTSKRLLTEADHEMKAAMAILGQEDLFEVGEVRFYIKH